MELLLGCGATRDKRFNPEKPWTQLVTLDINPDHKPDCLFDLEDIGDSWEEETGYVYYNGQKQHVHHTTRLPFGDDEFDELHAYEVLEHIGQQGDYLKYFAQFSEFWRILKDGGCIYATCPSWDNVWAWGDPSHSRIINEGTLVFLSQEEYTKQIGKTAMSDFRYLYKADFDIKWARHQEGTFSFVLQAIKPSRISI